MRIFEKALEFSGSRILDSTENCASMRSVSGAQGALDRELPVISLR